MATEGKLASAATGITGRIKQVVGRMTGSATARAGGKATQAEAGIKQAAGKLKDALRRSDPPATLVSMPRRLRAAAHLVKLLRLPSAARRPGKAPPGYVARPGACGGPKIRRKGLRAAFRAGTPHSAASHDARPASSPAPRPRHRRPPSLEIGRAHV